MECDGHDVTMRCDVEVMQIMLQKRKKKLGGGITSGSELEMMIINNERAV